MADELPGFIPQVLRLDDVTLLRADETVLDAMFDGWRAQLVTAKPERRGSSHCCRASENRLPSNLRGRRLAHLPKFRRTDILNVSMY